MIRFTNTLSGCPEPFKPLKEGQVGLYTCGPTVYDYAHIGNFRAFVFEDLLRRFLEYKGFKVRHVMNITDVDDKTIAGAAQEGKNLEDFTETYRRAFLEDLKTLNILPPNHPAEQPRATREIPAMLGLIGRLMKKGCAYESDGSVYYRVSSFAGYGDLSKKRLEKNIRGARVDRDEYDKEEGADFVLWKKAKEGEPAWDSPWGKGRPGWHIECSAMSMKYLGETFDIHAGGEDLVFPHHENEIAQSEAATGRPFVKYWLHCKFLLIHGEKMSKSKGNFYTLRDLLRKGYEPMAIRYSLLSAHYRQTLNFSLEGLQKEAMESIRKLDQCYAQCLSVAAMPSAGRKELASETHFRGNPELKGAWDRMLEGLEDDLNVSSAMAVLFETVRKINAWFQVPGLDSRKLEGALYFFGLVDRVFGFDIASVKSVPPPVTDVLREYILLRREKKFDQTDALREKMKTTGWCLQDGRPGEPSIARKLRRSWDLKK